MLFPTWKSRESDCDEGEQSEVRIPVGETDVASKISSIQDVLISCPTFTFEIKIGRKNISYYY